MAATDLTGHDAVPEIRFARANGSSTANQIFGDDPVTIAAVPPLAQHIERAWEWPAVRRMHPTPPVS